MTCAAHLIKSRNRVSRETNRRNARNAIRVGESGKNKGWDVRVENEKKRYVPAILSICKEKSKERSKREIDNSRMNEIIRRVNASMNEWREQ